MDTTAIPFPDFPNTFTKSQLAEWLDIGQNTNRPTRTLRKEIFHDLELMRMGWTIDRYNSIVTFNTDEVKQIKAMIIMRQIKYVNPSKN